MRLLGSILPSLLLAAAQVASAASSWGFADATLSVSSTGAGVGSGLKEKLTPASPLSKPVTLNSADSLKILLTTTEGKTPKRPHQAFLTLTDSSTGLEESFPLSIKDNGKGKLEISHKDLPTQLLTTSAPLKASLIVASFGSTTPYSSPAFTLNIEIDAGTQPPASEVPTRYRALKEIHHIFRDDPKSPPKIITIVFTLGVIAALPTVIGAWLALGGNFNHFSKALGAAPVSHSLFLGSIVAMEGVFFLYYTSWNLFQMLPVALAVGVVTFLGGGRALSEVQERRLAGLR